MPEHPIKQGRLAKAERAEHGRPRHLPGKAVCGMRAVQCRGAALVIVMAGSGYGRLYRVTIHS